MSYQRVSNSNLSIVNSSFRMNMHKLIGKVSFLYLLFTTCSLAFRSLPTKTFMRPFFSTSAQLLEQTAESGPLLHGRRITLTSTESRTSSRSFSSTAGQLVEQAVDTIEDGLLHARRAFMSHSDESIISNRPKVIILGTGWSSHALAKIIDTDMFDVSVVSPRPYFVFTPLLAATALGTIEHRSLVEPLRSSNPFVRYIQGEAIEISPDTREIIVETNLRGYPTKFSLSYNHLICGIGARVADFGLKSVYKYCHFIKEIDDVRKLRSHVLTNFETALLPDATDEEIDRLLTFVTIGGGPTGVEFTGELADFIEDNVKTLFPSLLNRVKVILLDAGQTILTAFDSALQTQALESIRKRGVKVLLSARVTDIQANTISYISSNPTDSQEVTTIDYGVCVWAAGTAPRPLIEQLADKVSQSSENSALFKRTGRVLVDPWLRVCGTPPGSVFAMGDCAVTNPAASASAVRSDFEPMGEGPLPQTAQVAAQQGAFVGHILNRGYNVSDVVPSLPSDTLVNNPMTWLRVRGVLQASPFSFLNFGLLTYIGGDEALAQVKLGDLEVFKTSGELAYLLWKSVYLVKQVSFRTRVLVLFDFIKVKVFGRDLTNL